MNADEFRRLGHALVDWVAEYRETLEQRPVMARVKPGEIKAKLPSAPPEHGGSAASIFEQLAVQVAEAPPQRPTPLSQDGLLGLFSAKDTGRDVVLQPASPEDMCGGTIVTRPSLEVVYDSV